MRDVFQEKERSGAQDRDNSSGSARGLGRSVEPPYRDRREALIARRRALSSEQEETGRLIERRDRIDRQLAVIDDELRASVAPLLASIAIGTSCRARWDDMIGTDVVRHCTQCRRDVHDISRMSRDEVHALLALAEERPCVRLRRRPDGRVVTADCPAPERKTLPRAIACAAAGAVLGVSASGLAALALAPGATHAEAISGGHVVASAPSRNDRRGDVRVAAFRGAPESEPESVSGDTTMGDIAFPESADWTPLELDRDVRSTASQSWEIRRALLQRALGAPVPAWALPRLLPRERDGRIVGLAVYGIRRADLFGRLGLQNGDTLLEINGHAIAEPDGAIHAYSELRSADSFFVRVERRGRERLHVYRVVP